MPVIKVDADDKQAKPQLKNVAGQKEESLKRPVKRFSEQLKSPSIKDALAGKFKEDKLSVKEQHEIYTNTGEITDFSADELGKIWSVFLERLDDRPNLQSTLSKPPSLGNDYQLVLEIDNSLQDDLINTIKPELVSWLRKQLKNSKIHLVTRLSENEKEKIIYTDSEKYLELLKKNPGLEILKQKFNLDFE